METKKIMIILILVELIGVFCQISAWYHARYGEVTQVTLLDEERDEEFFVKKGEEEEEITLEIPSRTLSADETDAIFSSAEEEIDATFLGENQSFDEITQKVVLRDSYVDGKAEASWSFDPSGIVVGLGNIDFDEVKDDTCVTATAEISVGEETRLFSFPIIVKPASADSKEGFSYLLQSYLKREKQEDVVELPQRVDGVSLTWKKPMEYTGLQICMLGGAAIVLVYFGKRFDKRKETEKEQEIYLKDYPSIINSLVLYIGAGMSVRSAFERIGEAYLKDREKKDCYRPAYENILVLNRKLKDGVDERRAMEEFGRSCKDPAYEKLTLYVNQNIRRGNRELLQQLEGEERLLYESRQRKLKTAGELTSTKLLIPMGGLLIMVLIIIILPAFSSMQI